MSALFFVNQLNDSEEQRDKLIMRIKYFVRSGIICCTCVFIMSLYSCFVKQSGFLTKILVHLSVNKQE